MPRNTAPAGTDAAAPDGAPSEAKPANLDEADRNILRILQRDAAQPLERVAKKVGLSKTAVWNRVQRMQQERVILRQAVIVDPVRAGVPETFFVAVKTSRHTDTWLEQLQDIVRDMPEIMDAHRLAGEIDYLLKVQVASTRDFDTFYKRLVSRIELYSVTSSLSMEVLKQETALPL